MHHTNTHTAVIKALHKSRKSQTNIVLKSRECRSNARWNKKNENGKSNDASADAAAWTWTCVCRVLMILSILRSGVWCLTVTSLFNLAMYVAQPLKPVSLIIILNSLYCWCIAHYSNLHNFQPFVVGFSLPCSSVRNASLHSIMCVCVYLLFLSICYCPFRRHCISAIGWVAE